MIYVPAYDPVVVYGTWWWPHYPPYYYPPPPRYGFGAGLAALVIALFTISVQTIRAATANPVESLRYE